MYPILFRIWNFPVNTYGVFLALAFLGAIFVTVKLAARDGLPRERIYDLCLWLLLSSLVGSKLLMFFTEPEYREHPLQIISLDFLRLRARDRAGECAGAARMFLGRVLLGQTNELALGRALYRTRPRSHRRADGSEAASDTTLRIRCDADCVFLFAVAAQTEKV